MRNEIEVILLGCITDRSEKEEKRLNDLLRTSEDWAFITGELIRHRINGNFYTSLLPEQRKYIIGKVSQTFKILSRCYEEYNKNILEFFQKLTEKTDDAGISVAGLKGIIFNTILYKLGARRSNDIDILVEENDLKTFDDIMRKLGFIQSLDGGKTEASKKEKLIQIMNYHDLVPYYKFVDYSFMDFIKVDVNFHFDSKEHDITRAILNEGTYDYCGNGYIIRGLKWKSHLLHLCVHFYREASNSIWTSSARDVDLYKVVDIHNTLRCYRKEELLDWCKYVEKYQLNKQCYFTFFYLNRFYPNTIYTEIMRIIKPQDVSFLNKVETAGGNIQERKVDFFEQAFDMRYGKNFADRDLANIF
jgi:hypothetical protein